MIQRLFYCSIFILFISQINVQGQIQKSEFHSDSIFIYRDFHRCGSTANLYNNHKYLDSLDVSKVQLNDEGLSLINDILGATKGKKLFQQKYGGDIYYMIAYQYGLKRKCIVFFSDLNIIIDDLSYKRRWKIEDNQHTEILKSSITN